MSCVCPKILCQQHLIYKQTGPNSCIAIFGKHAYTCVCARVFVCPKNILSSWYFCWWFISSGSQPRLYTNTLFPSKSLFCELYPMCLKKEILFLIRYFCALWKVGACHLRRDAFQDKKNGLHCTIWLMCCHVCSYQCWMKILIQKEENLQAILAGLFLTSCCCSIIDSLEWVATRISPYAVHLSQYSFHSVKERNSLN